VIGDVCVECVPDGGLTGWMVLENPSSSVCDFCGNVGVTSPVVDLFEYMLETISRDWAASGESDQVPFSHEFRDDPMFQPDEFETEQLLTKLGEPLGDGPLRDSFCQALPTAWSHNDTWTGTRRQNLEWGWQDFSATLKNEKRYTTVRAPRIETSWGSDTPPHKMLDHLANVIEQTGLVRPLQERNLFRARKHGPGQPLASQEHLGAPAPQYAEAQRMSPAGISFFYGSADVETCLAEIRGLSGELATVGRWRIKTPLVVLDLMDLPEVPSVFDSLYGDIRDLVGFIQWFVGEITRPVLAHDRPSVDYVPSQAVAEFIRFELEGTDQAGIAGVRFPSVARTGGVNVALFDGPALHDGGTPVLTLEETSEFRADQVRVSWIG
jgi:hypothetical protein